MTSMIRVIAGEVLCMITNPVRWISYSRFCTECPCCYPSFSLLFGCSCGL